MRKKPNKIMKSFRLDPKTIKQMEYLADEMALTITDIIEIATNRYYNDITKKYKEPNTLALPK